METIISLRQVQIAKDDTGEDADLNQQVQSIVLRTPILHESLDNHQKRFVVIRTE